jgi:hypothetical protein
MPTRRRFRGVISGFLGTYASRASDYQGYWLFGFLTGAPEILTIDLLEPPAARQIEPALDYAVDLAKQIFGSQVDKAGLPPASARGATLTLERQPGMVSRAGGEHLRRGYDIVIRLSVLADTGRRFSGDAVLFAAPHNPLWERRRVDEKP